MPRAAADDGGARRRTRRSEGAEAEGGRPYWRSESAGFWQDEHEDEGAEDRQAHAPNAAPMPQTYAWRARALTLHPETLTRPSPSAAAPVRRSPPLAPRARGSPLLSLPCEVLVHILHFIELNDAPASRARVVGCTSCAASTCGLDSRHASGDDDFVWHLDNISPTDEERAVAAGASAEGLARPARRGPGDACSWPPGMRSELRSSCARTRGPPCGQEQRAYWLETKDGRQPHGAALGCRGRPAGGRVGLTARLNGAPRQHRPATMLRRLSCAGVVALQLCQRHSAP